MGEVNPLRNMLLPTTFLGKSLCADCLLPGSALHGSPHRGPGSVGRFEGWPTLGIPDRILLVP